MLDFPVPVKPQPKPPSASFNSSYNHKDSGDPERPLYGEESRLVGKIHSLLYRP